MGSRARRLTPAVFTVAAALYAANCALGTSVALRLVDTRRFRWVHHLLYIATSASTVVALSSAVWGVPAARARRAAAALAPALAPLAALPYAGMRTSRHPLVALTAAPFMIAGVVRSR